VVYIEEAHPIDAWQDEDNEKAHIAVGSEKSLDERCAVAGACVRKLGIEIPALVDGFDDSVERAYTAWPDRLYVLDREGRVAWKSAPGPFGFDPSAAEAALKPLL
jgi:hypothetical protein